MFVDVFDKVFRLLLLFWDGIKGWGLSLTEVSHRQ